MIPSAKATAAAADRKPRASGDDPLAVIVLALQAR